MQAEVLFDLIMDLGEGPLWDERADTLHWVDINAGEIWSHDFKANATTSFDTGETVGMCALDASGHMVAALQHDIVRFHDGQRTVLASAETHLADNRFNDGKCDARGRLLAGTMATKGDKAMGAFYSLTEGQPLRVLATDIGCSNGVGWSVDNKTLYYVDTPSGHLWGFDYDIDTGKATNRRSLIDYTKEPGNFDGLCVDGEGMIWAAHWGGHRVSRWDPKTGKKLSEIMVPAPFVTSCCFGGPDMQTLYITTARGGEKDREGYPLAGSLFAVRPGVAGLPMHRFGQGA